MESYKYKLVSYYWNGDKEYGFVLEVQKAYNGHYVLDILNQSTKQTHIYYTEYGKVNLEE
jgi:hypothetical protein